MTAAHTTAGPKFRALLIDPIKRAVDPIDVDAASERATRAHVRRLIGCEAIESVPLSADDCLWLDRDGMTRDLDAASFFMFREGRLPFCGRGVILGTCDDDDSASTGLRALSVAGRLNWPGNDEARRLIERATAEDRAAADTLAQLFGVTALHPLVHPQWHPTEERRAG